MKDIHTHILYGIDDGAKTIEESLAILKKAEANGVTDIVLTPHYIKDTIYNVNKINKLELLEELRKEVNRNNININLYLGNEVYIDEDIPQLLENDICTINNSKYILIEFSLNNEPLMLDQILYQLKQKNLIPIIAHPERYLIYYKDYNFFENLIRKGCLLQGNIGSLYGVYGNKTKKMFKGLLKRNMIHFLGSDIHHSTNNIYERNIRKDLLKIVKDEHIVDDLLSNNTDKVLHNYDI